MTSGTNTDLGQQKTDTETDGLLEGKDDSQKIGFIHKLKGVIAAFGAVLFYVTSGTAVQLLNRRIPDFELNTIRSAVNLIIYSSYILITGKWPVVPRDMIGATLGYVVASFLSAFCYYTAVSLLPAALEVSLQNSTSVIAGLFLFSVFWEEKMTLWKWMWAVLCIVGVVMITQPKLSVYDTDNSMVLTEQLKNATWILNAATESLNHVTYTTDHVTDTTYGTDLQGGTKVSLLNGTSAHDTISAAHEMRLDGLLGQIAGFILTIVAGVALSVSVLITKRNPYITENFLQVLFWTFMMSTVVSAAVMLAWEAPVLPSNVFDIVLVAMHSLLCAGVWPLCIIAPKYISGNTFTLIISTDVVFMLVSQYTVLSSIRPGHRNWIEGVGVVSVLLGSSMSTIMEMVKDRLWSK